MRDVKFQFMYSDSVNWITKVFGMTEIMNGYPFDFISDSPLLRDYKMVCYRQYIGTYKNGLEIYEGDIVSGVYTKPTPVEWGECDASIQGSVSDVPLLAFHIGGFPLCTDQDYEVVGNIYQNKYLLAPAGET